MVTELETDSNRFELSSAGSDAHHLSLVNLSSGLDQVELSSLSFKTVKCNYFIRICTASEFLNTIER